MPSRQHFQSVPNLNNLNINGNMRGQNKPRMRHRRSSLDMGMSELGAGEANMLGAVPSSFATQMAMATGMAKRQGGEETDGMMGRLMLARMKTLEEGFQEVIREFRGLSRANTTSANSPVETAGSEQATSQDKRRRKKEKGKERQRATGSRPISRASMKDFGSKGKGKEKDNRREQKHEGEKQREEQQEEEATGVAFLEPYTSKGNSL